MSPEPTRLGKMSKPLLPLWWKKTNLEGNNSSRICYVAFLVYFLTMASQAGRDIMNTAVAGSVFTVFPVFPVKRKKRDFLMFKSL